MNISSSGFMLRHEIQTVEGVNTFFRNICEEFKTRIRPKKPATFNECFSLA